MPHTPTRSGPVPQPAGAGDGRDAADTAEHGAAAPVHPGQDRTETRDPSDDDLSAGPDDEYQPL